MLFTKHIIGTLIRINFVFSNSKTKFEPVSDRKIQFFKKTPEVRKVETEVDWSYTSSDNCDSLFRRMFGEEAAQSFSVGHTKISYIIRHGLSDILAANAGRNNYGTSCKETM